MIELAYHRRSPSYRRGDNIVDPLHKATDQWEASTIDDDTLGAETRRMIERQNNDEIVETIRGHRNAHRVEGPWWRTFTWPYSTHENVHGAAVNGILAGEDSKYSLRQTCIAISCFSQQTLARSKGTHPLHAALRLLPRLLGSV